MKFEEALTAMRNGKKVKRPFWTSAFLFIVPGFDAGGNMEEVLYCGNENSDRIHRVRSFDISGIMSEDWEIVEREKK